jgi:hypothetical protein
MAEPKSKRTRHQHTATRKQRAKRKFAFLKELRRDTTLQPSAKMVVWSLAEDFYNLDDERCNPSFASLARAVGRRQRSVIDAIGEAKTRGWLEVSSIGGGSKRSTNRYTIVWDKRAEVAPEQAAENTNQTIEDIEETVSAANENSQSPEIIDETEIEVCSALHGCSPLREGVQSSAYEPTPNLKGEEEEGEVVVAARGFAAPPLAEEEEMAFQQLCQWPRYQYWPDFDEVKAREAFAAVCAEHGEQIRAQSGLGVGAYLVDRANVWVDAFAVAHPNGDGGRYLKRLEVWLGAPDANGKASPWWSLAPTPKASGGGRGRKPDLLQTALRGAAVAS